MLKAKRSKSGLKKSVLILAAVAAAPALISPLASGATYTWDPDGVADNIITGGVTLTGGTGSLTTNGSFSNGVTLNGATLTIANGRTVSGLIVNASTSDRFLVDGGSTGTLSGAVGGTGILDLGTTNSANTV